MGDYEPREGDRVRVTHTYEGYVGWTGLTGVDVYAGPDRTGEYLVTVRPSDQGEAFAQTIEKLAPPVPPVEVFGPGDTVRSRHYPEYVYTLGKNGYLNHLTSRVVTTDFASNFDSRDYERVTLVEPPL